MELLGPDIWQQLVYFHEVGKQEKKTVNPPLKHADPCSQSFFCFKGWEEKNLQLGSFQSNLEEKKNPSADWVVLGKLYPFI